MTLHALHPCYCGDSACEGCAPVGSAPEPPDQPAAAVPASHADAPQAARPPTNAHGKLTFDAGRLLLPDLIGEALTKQATAEGLPLLEFIRDVLAVKALGKQEVLRLAAERIDRMELISS